MVGGQKEHGEVYAVLPISVSVIVPTKNEEKNLPYVLPRIPMHDNLEVIVVDAFSSDDTVRVAQELLPGVKVVFQEGNGKGDAMKLGWKQATGDILVTLDADGSANPEEIPGLIEPLIQNGSHLVKGSRFLPGGGTLDMPLYRRIGNRGLIWTANALFGTKYSDLVYGLHAFRKDILEKVDIETDGFEIDTELYLGATKAGLKVVEVPSFESRRISGKSNLRSLRDGWGILKTILRKRFRQ